MKTMWDFRLLSHVLTFFIFHLLVALVSSAGPGTRTAWKTFQALCWFFSSSLFRLKVFKFCKKLEYQRGNFDSALQVFQGIDITALNPRMIKAIAERTKQIKPRSKALTEQKLEMEAWQDLTTIYADFSSFLDAKACVDTAQLIDIFSPRSWHITGMLFEAQSLYKQAFVSFSISLSIEPDYIPSIISAAELLLKLGMQSLPIARRFLMNALRLEPTNNDACFNLGLVSNMEGSLQQAADCFQAAYELKLSGQVQKFV